MMQFHGRPINHFFYIQDWATEHNADANLNLRDFVLKITLGTQSVTLFPQFLMRTNGQLCYARSLNLQATGFIGWRPYISKQWDNATNKIKFKEAILEEGLLTPSFSTSPLIDCSFIIKQSSGSFGKGIRGPFRNYSLKNAAHILSADEFYEQFISGEIIKAWFWNHIPICLEIRTPPYVQGDGMHTTEELTIQLVKSNQLNITEFHACKNKFHDVLSVQNCSWETILEKNQTVNLDFLYGSYFFRGGAPHANHNQLGKHLALTEELFKRGLNFMNTIPAQFKNGILYAVDGVLDRNGQVWWLELNCNPVMPPDGYSTMLSSVFNLNTEN